MGWTKWKLITDVVVNGSIIAGAIASIFKFKIYNMLSRRFRSEVQCYHYTQSNGKVLFICNYIIHNTGDVPIKLLSVYINLYGAATSGKKLLDADLDKPLAIRTLIKKLSDPDKGNYHIAAGERSIFTLRTEQDKLENVVFVVCRFDWEHKRVPASFKWAYVKNETKNSP